MLVTENYFHRVWCVTAYRRLKNVCVILEWIPKTTDIKAVPPTEIEGDAAKATTVEQDARLKRAFEMFNVSRTGQIDPSGAVCSQPFCLLT